MDWLLFASKQIEKYLFNLNHKQPFETLSLLQKFHTMRQHPFMAPLQLYRTSIKMLFNLDSSRIQLT